ncbi:MAG: SDR family oxidoreductase [Actinomycetota bacterium]
MNPFGSRPAIDRWHRALVTGASSGIGDAFARLLAANGTDLVVVARDGSRLAALADSLREDPAVPDDVEVEILVADLSDRSEVGAVAERLGNTDSPIDLLINNAGFGFAGDFVSLDPERELAVVDVNIGAVQRLTHAAGTAMSERGRGGILNVSSVAGFGPSPRTATYAANKAFVTSFSEAVHAELGPHGVVVTCLCPGLTRTEFQDRAEYDASGIPDALWQSAEEVAEAGLRGLAAGKAIVVPGSHNKALRAAMQAAPSSLVRRIGDASSSRLGKPGG